MTLSQRLLPLEHGLEIWKVYLDETREQDLNARTMRAEMFERMTATIGRDKRLESLPLLALTDAGLEIVSGHHRTRSARSAGLEYVFALVDTSGLTHDQIKTKQLAHNAIQGEDDPQLVARIFEQIEDVDTRLESFVDPAMLAERLKPVPVSNVSLDLEYRTALVVFLPNQQERFDAALEQVSAAIGSDVSAIYQSDLDRLDRFRQVVARTGKEYEVRSLGVVFEKIARIVLDALGDEPTRDEERIPLRDLFGVSTIPTHAAMVVGMALDVLEKQGDIGPRNRWQALEYLAAEYLAGAGVEFERVESVAS